MDLTVSTGSWLNLTQLLEFKGVIFWDQTEYPDIALSDDDTYIQLTDAQAHRIDLIAQDFYGDSELLWILQVANNVDLPNQFVEGQVIRIPAKATVSTLLAPKDIL